VEEQSSEVQDLQASLRAERASRESRQGALEQRLESIERIVEGPAIARGSTDLHAVLDGLHDCRGQIRASREACEDHLSAVAERLDHLEAAERRALGVGPQGLEGRLRRVRDEVAAMAATQESLERKLDERQDRMQYLFEAWAGGARDELSSLARSLARQARAEARTLMMAGPNPALAAAPSDEVTTPREPVAAVTLAEVGLAAVDAVASARAGSASDPGAAPLTPRDPSAVAPVTPRVSSADVSSNLDIFLALPAPTAAQVFMDRPR